VSIELHRKHWHDFTSIADGLYEAFTSSDASLAEINPLVVTKDGRLLALDGKIVLDDNALFRHHDLAEMRDIDGEAPVERDARRYGLSYVKLDGSIGCMVNGAGLAMATMDVIKLFGGEPANFLDIGGGASSDKVAAAFRLIIRDENVKAVLINIFGGITRCDEVARGILSGLTDIECNLPMVIRLVGTNENEGRKLLAEADMIIASSLVDATQKTITLAKEKQPK
jgi:succinyl-CoA synthetase beta subunit